MAKPRPPVPAKLVCAIFSASVPLIENAKKELEKHFGNIDSTSIRYKFTQTDHYEKTMGENLWKEIVSFQNLVEQDDLNRIKNLTNDLEKKISQMYQNEGEKEGVWERPMNLDPGLITGAKFILATMKDFSHRIYLGNSVYAEVTLMYAKGALRVQPWTYPDYQTRDVIQFLTRVRMRYMEQMEEIKDPGAF